MKKLLPAIAAVVLCMTVLSGCVIHPGEMRNDNPTENSVGAFDCYYDLATAKGLEVYVWKAEGGTYRCGLMSGTNRSKTSDEIAALPPASAEQMRAILDSYALPDENITLIPVINPKDRYPWELDGDEIQKLRELFGVQNVIDTVQEYETADTSCYDSISADIDGDGTEEVCTLGYGRTSGIFTFTFTATADGVPKYSNMYCSEWYDLSFTEHDGSVYVQGITQGAAPETHLFSISVENGSIVLSENGERLSPLQMQEAAD